MAAVVVLFGLGGPVTKLISAPPLVVAAVRFWLSAPLVWAIVYASGRRVPLAVLRHTVLAGVVFALNLVFLVAALQHASVAVISLITAVQPGVVLLLAGPWLGEWATRWHVLWTAVAVMGAVVVVLGSNPEVRGDATGVIFGIVSMLGLTAYFVLNRRVRSTAAVDAIQWTAGVTLWGAIAITPVALVGASADDFRQLAGADWLYMAYLAGVVGLGAHTMMSWAQRFIPLSRSALYLMAMHVVAIGASWPIHDEPVTLVQALGGLVVLGAVAAVISRPASVRLATEASARP
jgi:drug/metabolite transporter (DMT)-like permease